MIYTVDNINYVITGRNQKLVNLVITSSPSLEGETPETYSKTFVTDEGLDKIDDFKGEYNTHRLKILSPDPKTYWPDNTISTIYSLFDIRDVAIKTRQRKSKIFSNDGNNCKILYSDRLLDIYNSHMSSDPIEFCQLGAKEDSSAEAAGIAIEDRKFPALKKTNLMDTRYDRLVNGQSSLEWFYKISSDENSTFTYVPLSDLVLSHDESLPEETFSDPMGYYFVAKSCKQLSSQAFDYFFGNELGTDLNINQKTGISAVLLDHKVVEPNQIFLLDIDYGKSEDPMGVFNDFNNGIIRGNTYLGKNYYDAEFSMNMDSIEDIHHARNYIGIGNVGNRIFLKYYDETEYKSDGAIVDNGNGIQTLSSEKIQRTSNSYQNVEVLDSTMSFMGNYSRHKANLYAITVRNAGLSPEASPSLSAEMSKIRAQVENSIRTIAENLAPAHTQLLQVNFEDEVGIVSQGLENSQNHHE